MFMQDHYPQGLQKWSLFLDRDGVLNVRIPGDYVRSWEMWQWLLGSLEALAILRSQFRRMLIVSNQQGIGKGLYSHEDLALIHERMKEDMLGVSASFDGIYYCPDLAGKDAYCRKPNPGMAEQAKRDFPDINFHRSVMVGDRPSDMAFGNQLGMYTVLLETGGQIGDCHEDLRCEDLLQFANLVLEQGSALFGNSRRK
jgi:D-glycero-D-manno-heptose 1,7-bisphosphate phosphatase